MKCGSSGWDYWTGEGKQVFKKRLHRASAALQHLREAKVQDVSFRKLETASESNSKWLSTLWRFCVTKKHRVFDRNTVKVLILLPWSKKNTFLSITSSPSCKEMCLKVQKERGGAEKKLKRCQCVKIRQKANFLNVQENWTNQPEKT